METKKDIRSYIEKLSDDDCIGMLQDFNDRELLITIELMEKGIDPLAYGSPYRPIYAGVVYAKEGMEGIRRHHGLSVEGVREVLTSIMTHNNKIQKLLDKSDTLEKKGKIPIFIQDFDMAKVRRKTFKIVPSTSNS